MYAQSCNLWTGKKLLKQCESNIFKSNGFMLSMDFFILHYFMFLAITFETYNNIDSKAKSLFTLDEKF